jgi:hypothetical protein
MAHPLLVLLWLRSLSLAADLGPPLDVLLAELDAYAIDYWPRVFA